MFWEYLKHMGGRSKFFKISEMYMTPRSHPKEKNKTLNLTQLTVNICLNKPFNSISQGVSISLPPRGGDLIPPLWNQGRSCFRPHVAKSYFETYKSYDHMQNFRPLSQKFSEISRFENFEFLRFCLTLTHRNCHNSLNFGFIPLFMCSINHV